MGSHVFGGGTVTPPKVDPAVVAVAAVPTALLLVCAAIVAGALFSYHPFWPDDQPTFAEAIIMRDMGALVQRLEERPDVRQRFPVRPGMINDRSLELTPYEAVVAAKRDDVYLVLKERGMTPPPESVLRLQCLAARTSARDVLTLLGELPPDADCSEDRFPTPW